MVSWATLVAAEKPESIIAKVMRKLKTAHAISQHKLFAAVESSNRKLVRVFDWKASLTRGWGPETFSTRIHE